jgi:hypothetical protein
MGHQGELVVDPVAPATLYMTNVRKFLQESCLLPMALLLTVRPKRCRGFCFIAALFLSLTLLQQAS